MDNIVITDKLNLGSFGIQQNEDLNNNFFNTSDYKITGSALDYFHLINQMNDINNRITVLEKGKENTIDNAIVAAEKLNKNMAELKETITFNDDMHEDIYNNLMDALHDFITNWE